MEQIENALTNGHAVGLGLSGAIAHAVTCFGYTYNESGSKDDHTYYTGLFITDSDDNKTESSPSDTIRFVSVKWDSAHNIYQFGDDSQWYMGGNTYGSAYLDSIVTLAQIDSAFIPSNPTPVTPTKPNPTSSKIVYAGETVSLARADSKYDVFGTFNVNRKGKATSTQVESGGVQNVNSAGNAIKTQIWAGGTENIYSGGKATSSFVSSGGQQIVFAKGTTVKTVVYGGGTQHLSAGIASNTILSGGVQNIDVDDASLQGTALNTTILEGGIQYVTLGIARNTIIKTGGTQINSANGSSLKTTISSGGMQINVAGSSINTLIASYKFATKTHTLACGMKASFLTLQKNRLNI